MNNAWIVSGSRTPIGRFLGDLASVTAPHLAGETIRHTVDKSGIDPSRVDEVFVGNVVAAGVGQAPAKQASSIRGSLNRSVAPQ